MKHVLTGISGIKQLSAKKQQAFERFYHISLNHKLRPVIADFTILTIWIGSLVNIFAQLNFSQPDSSPGWGDVHHLSYLYCASLMFLGIVNFFTTIRQRAPLMVYLVFILIMVFAYRDFVVWEGWTDPVLGLSFALAFVGYMTLSVRHSIILWAIYISSLMFSHRLVYGADEWLLKAGTLLNDRFVFGCFTTGLLSACFVRWLFRNLFAMQYLLNDKNEMLTTTLKTLKTTEEQLIQQQKYQALNHMAKGLLHEIINPVNSSSQALRYAQSVNQDQDVGDALEDAASQQKRISDIVTDLRRFARSEIDQELETVSVGVLVANAIKLCHQEIKSTNVEVVSAVDEKQLIDCHPSALTQVFVNLLLNSCSALKQKTSDKSRVINITSVEQEENLLILFRDNGAGIDQVSLKQIMDPFFTKGNSPGTMGLGLSICQTIMRHHNGFMKIDSEINQWTEVELSIPCRISVSQFVNASPESSRRDKSANPRSLHSDR